MIYTINIRKGNSIITDCTMDVSCQTELIEYGKKKLSEDNQINEIICLAEEEIFITIKQKN